MYKKGYGKFTFTYCSYGAPKNMTSPCFDKMSKTSFLGMELTPNHQEMYKTKFESTNNHCGPLAAPIFHTPHFYPPPPRPQPE